MQASIGTTLNSTYGGKNSRPNKAAAAVSTKGQMLEKNYTRQPHILNFMKGINELPHIDKGRPNVKHVRKRESLLLKGQSDELNASMGSDHSSIFRKANEKITGKLSMASSRERQEWELKSPTEHLKLQFKMPLAQNTIMKALSPRESNSPMELKSR